MCYTLCRNDQGGKLLRLKTLAFDYLLRVLDLEPGLRARLELFRKTGATLSKADCEELRERWKSLGRHWL
jgi:hypothetical protein